MDDRPESPAAIEPRRDGGPASAANVVAVGKWSWSRGDRHASTALLLICLLLELILFGWTGRNFFTVTNGLEILRLATELGLLVLALTPVILSGGIDLSVGSWMGLAAVMLGMLWRDAGWPWWLAVVAVLAGGGCAGLLNGVLITRLRLPPLIVTLGTYSLFRGLAEGATGGVENYTNFPNTFVFLGQGYWFGFLPAQLPILLLAATAFWYLVHRTIWGRWLVAIGYSPSAARYSGLNVDRCTASVYILSGVTASLAAVIYVAHVGQAKADAGTGYELLAITAVVLGGTSIFGGRGTIHGSLLGLLAIVILQNGLRLSDLPAELAGVFTGLLLLITIGSDQWLTHYSLMEHGGDESEEFQVKNYQVAILAVVILAAAGLIAASNIWLARSMRESVERLVSSSTAGRPTGGPGSTVSAVPGVAPREASTDGKATGTPATTVAEASSVAAPAPARRVTVAMMPKSKGNAYFIACRKGAEEAARELGVELIWDGPTDTDPAKQNEVVETWITRGCDVIAVACENRDGIASVLRKARAAGIHVITWDADTTPDAREYFVNQATPQQIGYSLMDTAARVLDGRGEFAIVTASLTAGNQIEWIKHIEARLAEKYPEIQLAMIRPSDDKQDKAFDETAAILKSNPNVRLIMSICSPAVPGAAEAVKQSGRKDVKVIGLGLPNDNKRYVHEGITDTVILWNTMDLGYLTIQAGHALATGRLQTGATTFNAGRLQSLRIDGDNILLGDPYRFTAENIDQFDF
ncbi:MAG: substrate-binding domain-containing protein [Pirellulales bacterium]